MCGHGDSTPSGGIDCGATGLLEPTPDFFPNCITQDEALDDLSGEGSIEIDFERLPFASNASASTLSPEVRPG